jgi:hypothetical protein
LTTTVSTAVGQYATALGNSRKLFRDSYGKYIAVYKNSTVRLGYCNNDPPTSGWSDNTLGYGVDAGEAFGVGAAYDSTNDQLMVCWVQSANLKLMRITFTRDGSHNITAYSAGSLLEIPRVYDTVHSPSLWMLHNGEVACVWSDDKTGGAKHSVVKFCRVVFGSPPTYKNAAGTASSVDTISSDYTSGFTLRGPSIVERINSGTGQYDLFAFFGSSYSSAYFKKNKASWSSPNWSWGTEADVSTASIACTFVNYDTVNGLIIVGGFKGSQFIADTSIYIYSIDASDTQTTISITGLSSKYRLYGSLSINQANGGYYLFYTLGSVSSGPFDVYYAKRLGGSWGSETQFTTTTNENYPSCKVDGAGNRIELIWTHYTGSAYNVYYDYLSLGALTQNISETASETGASATQSLSQVASGLLSWMATIPLTQIGSQLFSYIATILLTQTASEMSASATQNIMQSSMDSIFLSNVSIPLTQVGSQSSYSATISLTQTAIESFTAALSGLYVNLTETGFETIFTANVSFPLVEIASEPFSYYATIPLTQASSETGASATQNITQVSSYSLSWIPIIPLTQTSPQSFSYVATIPLTQTGSEIGASATQNITQAGFQSFSYAATIPLTQAAAESLLMSNVAIPLTEVGQAQVIVSNITIPLSEISTETVAATISGLSVSLTETGFETLFMANIAFPLMEIAAETAAIINIAFSLTETGTETATIINISFSLTQTGTETGQTGLVNITQASIQSEQMTNVMIPLNQTSTENSYTATFSIMESSIESFAQYVGVIVFKLELVIGNVTIDLKTGKVGFVVT